MSMGSDRVSFNASVKTTGVSGVSRYSTVKTSSKGGKTENKKSDEGIYIEEKLDEGQLKKKKSAFGGSWYVYTANGEETYGEIKEMLGLKDGALRDRNHGLFAGIKGNADDAVPAKGTKINIASSDLPSKDANMVDDSGEKLDGFYMSYDGCLYYEVREGDTPTSIYNKLSNSCFKDYNTKGVMDLYPEKNLQIGTKISIPEKSGISKFFSKIFG